MNWAAMVWLGMTIFFIFTELASVSITSLWFAVGALVAMIASLLGAQLWLQAVLFVAVSAVLLWQLRPVVKKYFTPRLVRTNVDAVIGTEGIVTAAVDNLNATGTVKLGSLEWSARSTSGESIAVGSRVRVDKVEGVKVFVTAVEETAAV